MRYLQETISKWQNATFGNNTTHILGIFNHLKKEIKELGKELVRQSYTNDRLEHELADCIILLIGLADAFGIDLEIAITEKMQRNVKREWKKPDKHGVIEHK